MRTATGTAAGAASAALPGPWVLARWFVLSAWRAQRGRWLTAAAAIAIGIALAVAIRTVNRSALAEFQQAIATVNGDAQLQVLPRAQSFDEAAYPIAARTPGVAAASPVVDVEVEVDLSGRRRRLQVIGVDVFRAMQVTPSLVPRLAATVSRDDTDSGRGDPANGGPTGADAPQSDGSGGSGSHLFDSDAIYLSPAALAALGARIGDTLVTQVGLARVPLRVRGTIDPGAGRALAAMDIGAAQWRLGLLGRLSRIDLRLDEGASPARVAEALAGRLPPDATVALPDARVQRMSNVSRAYRVNLNVLALVALFTGAFLVFSTVALSVVRQREQLALMAVLGASARWLRATVVAQGVAIAAAGSALGVPAGLALAWALLEWVGGDLGGGYFAGSRPALQLGVAGLAGFALLGVAVGAVAAWLPARDAARTPAARALHRGSAEQSLERLSRRWPALALATASALLAAAPPVRGLPIPAYVSIACLLLAGIAAVPWLVQRLFALPPRLAHAALWRRPAAWLATLRIAQAPGVASGTIAGVVASFALTVAMVIMVSSFREAVVQWLDTVLPADVYTRAPASGAQAGFTPALQARVQAVPGVRSVELVRAVDLTLDPARPPVVLLARPIDAADPGRTLPLTGTARPAPAGTVPIYVSEAMVDLYGFAPGRTVSLPVGDGRTRFFVAAVWRDYARQFGSIALDAAAWRALTGDANATQLSVRLTPGTHVDEAIARLRAAVPELASVELRSAQDLRALSLAIFDRSFAMTYLLEAAALIVALFGIASGYAGQALARAREFGVLRHLGATRRDIAAQIAIEGGLLTAFGTLWGGLIGFAIGLILIHRVNPQSFHWTMQLDMPWLPVIGSALALAACGAAAALLAARAATAAGPLQAVREDD